MTIDGIMLAAIHNNLKKNIVGARIDKIYQVEKQLLTFTLRQGNKNIKLLISANPQDAFLHLTKENFENPLKPPDFCMLLRKYLIRGIITNIEQPNFERILNISIKNYNHNYNLFIEIMGKYTNIMLVNEDGIILDALKRISKELSREREVYPGISYHYPPEQDKENPLTIKKDDFIKIISSEDDFYNYKLFIDNFKGIGPNMAKEIFNNSTLDHQEFPENNSENIKKLWLSFSHYFEMIKSDIFKPTIGLNNNNEILYISPFPLKYKINCTEELNFNDLNQLFEYYYQNNIKIKKLKGIKTNLFNVLKKYLKKNHKQQNKYFKLLDESKNAEKYKKLGEIITANIYRLKKGLSKVELPDFYQLNQNKITIHLDPRLTPAQNAQYYFKKYTKTKKSTKHLNKQLISLQNEEKYLKQVKLMIEQAENTIELREIKEELIAEGYIKEKRKNIKKRKKDKPLPPYQFKSTQGYDIFIGRNNRQNDYLTNKFAKKHDLWLHIKDLPGSHVIIKINKDEEIPEETLKEAAVLAAYYSKGRMSQNVPIDYTEVKNVKKPKGAKPGLVIYENNRTIYVNPDREIIEKIQLKRTR